jgi:hypothetical protein
MTILSPDLGFSDAFLRVAAAKRVRTLEDLVALGPNRIRGRFKRYSQEYFDRETELRSMLQPSPQNEEDMTHPYAPPPPPAQQQSYQQPPPPAQQQSYPQPPPPAQQQSYQQPPPPAQQQSYQQPPPPAQQQSYQQPPPPAQQSYQQPPPPAQQQYQQPPPPAQQSYQQPPPPAQQQYHQAAQNPISPPDVAPQEDLLSHHSVLDLKGRLKTAAQKGDMSTQQLISRGMKRLCELPGVGKGSAQSGLQDMTAFLKGLNPDVLTKLLATVGPYDEDSAMAAVAGPYSPNGEPTAPPAQQTAPPPPPPAQQNAPPPPPPAQQNAPPPPPAQQTAPSSWHNIKDLLVHGQLQVTPEAILIRIPIPR